MRRKTLMSQRSSLLSFLSLALMLSGSACAKKESASLPSSSVSADPGSTLAPSTFHVDAYVGSGLTYYHHVAGDFSKNCEVSQTASAADRTIVCYADIGELDLYFNGVKFSFNAPPGMCEYVTFMPYAYFGYSAGTGASAVATTMNSGVLTVTSQTPAAPATVEVSTTNALKCIYDHTADEGPNCCVGDYTETRTTISDSDTVVAVNRGEWGGKIGDCMVGPGADSQPKAAKSNMPLRTIYRAGAAGLKLSYQVEAPVSKLLSTNLYAANYVPDPILAPPVSMRGPLTSAWAPWYEWSCYEGAEELVARIRVQVREWNLLSELARKDSGDSDAATPVPSPDDPSAGNDIWDWADWVLDSGDSFLDGTW